MNVEQLKERGFFFESVPESLTRVGHQEPFRFFRTSVFSVPEGVRDATIAHSHPDGKGFAFLTTNSWQQLQGFPFVLIMETDYKRFQALLGNLEAAEENLRSARQRLATAQAKFDAEVSTLA